MSFNLNTLAKADSTSIPLLHPATEAPLLTDDGEAISIVVYSTSSKEYKNRVNAMNNARIKRGKQKSTAEQLEADAVELLVACSKEALNLELDGQPINTPEAFRKLYSNPQFDWLREQVDTAIVDHAAFLNQ